MKTYSDTPEKSPDHIENSQVTKNNEKIHLTSTVRRSWTLGCGLVRVTPTVSKRLLSVGIKSLGGTASSGHQLFPLTPFQSQRLRILDFYKVSTVQALLSILLPTDSDTDNSQLKSETF